MLKRKYMFKCEDETRCVCEHNASDNGQGQDHKDKYFDTSRKILSQEMTLCKMEALVSYPKEVMTNVFFFLIGQMPRSKD